MDLEDFDGQKAHAVYSHFAIGSEQEKYALKLLGRYEGGGAGKDTIALQYRALNLSFHSKLS